MTVIICPQQGKVDCWRVQCPRVLCRDTVIKEGDCCPSCQGGDTLCDADSDHMPATVDTDRVCVFYGRHYKSGQLWHLSGDQCTVCRCKVSLGVSLGVSLEG